MRSRLLGLLGACGLLTTAIAADVDVISKGTNWNIMQVIDSNATVGKLGLDLYVPYSSSVGLRINAGYFGVESYINSNFWDGIYGVYSQTQATGSIWNHALVGAASSTVSAPYATNFGLYASAVGDGTNYGVYATTWGDTTQAWAGYFDGKVVVTGSLVNGSDLTLKRNVRSLDRGLDKLLALKPKAYELKGDLRDITTAGGTRFGLIAQEVQEVLPEVVEDVIAPRRLSKGENGKAGRGKDRSTEGTRFKSVDYTALIPVLIQAVQEQQAEIEALKAQLASRR